MKEQAQSEITIFDMDATAVDLLLDYAYTGQITITVDNVQVLNYLNNFMSDQFMIVFVLLSYQIHKHVQGESTTE